MPHTNQRTAYGQALVDMGRKNKNIVVLDADLGSSTMGRMFENEFPDRHLEVGIAEANMTSMAAGLALVGKVPFTNSFAVFSTGRSYDQIRQSIAIGNVNVKICGSSAGLSDFGDGATHQSIEDIAIMRALPHFTVISPFDANEAYQAALAAVEHNGPVYLRLNRNDYDSITPEDKPFIIGEPVIMKDGSDVAVLATGYMVHVALEAAKSLEGKVSVKVVNIHTIKPLDSGKVRAALGACKSVVTVEEHSIIGGLGSAVAEALRHDPVPMEFIGLNDTFGRSAHNYKELLEYFELTPEKVAQAILKIKK
ncbi:MAG: transketolase family protein [Defluviitaleaceae bacterium]|nr:transketolase family protein [Defluviitaleaceae bacterium]